MEDVNSLWYKLCTVLVTSQRFAVGKGPLSLEEYPCDVCQLKGNHRFAARCRENSKKGSPRPPCLWNNVFVFFCQFT